MDLPASKWSGPARVMLGRARLPAQQAAAAAAAADRAPPPISSILAVPLAPEPTAPRLFAPSSATYRFGLSMMCVLCTYIYLNDVRGAKQRDSDTQRGAAGGALCGCAANTPLAPTMGGHNARHARRPKRLTSFSIYLLTMIRARKSGSSGPHAWTCTAD